MGRILQDGKHNGTYEEFVHGLQQMYSGTKKWGTVRVAVKRCKYGEELVWH